MFFIIIGCSIDYPIDEKNDSKDLSISFDLVGRMHTIVSINDEETDVIFDTGSSDLTLDYGFIQYDSSSDNISPTQIMYVTNGKRVHGLSVKRGIDLLFGDKTIHYDKFLLDSISVRFGVSAIVPIPEDDKHIWGIDYENRRLSVLDSFPEWTKKKHCYESDIERAGADIFFTLPMTLSDDSYNSEDVRLTGIIDTGSGADVTLYGGLYVLDDKDVEAFVSRCNHHESLSNASIYYELQQTRPFPYPVIAEVKKGSYYSSKTFGNNLLSHFNIWLDLTNNRMFAYLVEDYNNPFREALIEKDQDFNFVFTKEGILVLNCLEHSSLWESGLRIADVIVAVDGKPFGEIGRRDIYEFQKGEKEHILNIVRGNKGFCLSFESSIF